MLNIMRKVRDYKPPYLWLEELAEAKKQKENKMTIQIKSVDLPVHVYNELITLLTETKQMLEIGHLDVVTAKQNLDHAKVLLDEFPPANTPLGITKRQTVKQLTEDMAKAVENA